MISKTQRETVWQLSDGNWKAQYLKGYDSNGKAEYAIIAGRSYEEVKSASLSLSAPEIPLYFGKIKTYNDCLDSWLEYVKPRVKESSYVRYYNIAKNHFRPALGELEVNDIRTPDVERFVSHLLKSGQKNGGGLSSSNAANILVVLRDTFRFAEMQGLRVQCRFDRLQLRRNSEEVKVLSRHDEDLLVFHLTADPTKYKTGVMLALCTGIRIGELCALQWKNISLDDKLMRICATLQRVQIPGSTDSPKTHVVLSEPKSDAARRIIPLPDFLVPMMGKHKAPPDAFFLSGEADRRIEPRVMQIKFKEYLTAAGVKDVNFHVLRHTFATRCVEAGFDIKSLSELLGHSNVQMTLNKYVHSTLEQKRINMDKLYADRY